MDVSVVICCYNEQRFLDRCLRSLVDQEYFGNYEIILVDDHSNDNSLKIAERFRDKIKIIKNNENKGIGYCSQRGFHSSIGKYFVRVDADDYVSKFFIQTLFLAMNEGLYNCVATDYSVVDESGTTLGIGSCDTKPIACGVIYSRDMLNELGGYNPNSRIYEDEDLRSRVIKKYEIVRLPIPLYRYRLHSDNSTGMQAVAAHIVK